MRIGVPKEIKSDEYRVGLTPGAVREYVAAGHQVLVERNAGTGIGASNDDYGKAGAELVSTSCEIYPAADLIVKVKEPQSIEVGMLRRGQVLFTYLHLASDLGLAEGLLRSGCTAIAYETITDRHGKLPLLTPMSEVAGRLAVEAAANVLVAGASTPKILSRAMLKTMKPGAVIVDVAIDQGGCCESSRPTTHSAPTFVVDGIVHYCVANMPAAVPLTSTYALSNATLPIGLTLAGQGLSALKQSECLRAGLNVYGGCVTCRPLAESLRIPLVPAEKALTAA